MTQKWASLHNHSEFSFADGSCSAEQWLDAAISMNINGFGITNHASAGDIIDFYNLSKKKNIPVCLGTEFYCIDNRQNRDHKNRYSHINLWCKNEEGYKNLCILNSIAWEEDRFYYRPRIDFDDLKKYSSGLICGSACAGGILAKQINEAGDDLTEKGYEYLKFLLSIFDKDFYLEVMPADLSNKWDSKAKAFVKKDYNFQENVNKVCQKISKQYDIKIIATIDAHFIKKSDKIVQDVQLKSSPENKDGWCFAEAYYLSGYDETINRFKEKHPYIFDNNSIYEYMENTMEIVDKCKDLKLNFKPLLPEINYRSLKDVIIQKGILDLNDNIINDRLNYELEVLTNNGKIDLTNYFLVLSDLIDWCKENNIPTGPGRGSSCGSIVAYGLGIVKINPLKHDLSFERFINIARIQENALPDIDLDVSRTQRYKIFEYFIEKYGSDKVASIGTTQTCQLRSALKDVVRALEPSISVDEINKITKSLRSNEKKLDNETYILYEASRNYQFKNLLLKNGKIFKVLAKILGQARQRGTHAAAVVISPQKLMEIVPLCKVKGEWVTQYTMSNIEKIGLIKYDILGLNTLDVIDNCVNSIDKKFTDKDIIEKYNNDRQVLDKFEECDTDSVFQFNTDVAKSILKKTKIKDIEDLSNVTALGRPNILDVGMHSTYIKRANNIEPIDYFHDSVKNILKSTYGIMLYQEQVMKCFQKIGGFNAVDAEQVRRAIGKKKEEILLAFKSSFVENAQKIHTDIDLGKAEHIWKLIESNAGYGFNKCLAGNTLVETSRGKKEISKIKVGDKVKAFNIENKNFDFVPVKNILKQGIKTIYEFVVENKSSIQCTMDHKFLCDDFNIRTMEQIIAYDYSLMCYGTHKYKKSLNTQRITFGKKIGDIQAYDIEIDTNDHLFLANDNFIVSNSHSVAYSYIGYICQFLKTYFPLQWWCSVLKYEEDNDQLAFLYHNLKHLLILPDINLSKKYFYINNEKIVMPLNYIMQLGDKALDNIIENQPYTSLSDFANKVNKRVVRKDIVSNLILAGAFNQLEELRDKDLIKKYYEILGEIAGNKKPIKEFEEKYQHLTRFEIIKIKNKILPGCSVNYLDVFKDRFNYELKKHNRIPKMSDKTSLITGGLISKININKTKGGNKYARVVIEDGNHNAKLILWPEMYEKYKSLLVEDNFIIVSGNINVYNDTRSVVVDELKILEI